MKSVSRERVDKVLAEFTTIAADAAACSSPTPTTTSRACCSKALGEDKANLLIDRILQGGDVSGHREPEVDGRQRRSAELMRNEHPQIVAAILVHLDSDQASAVLKTFAERQRNEVMVRIATLDGIQPAALKDLNEVMGKLLAGGEQAAQGAARRRQDRGRDASTCSAPAIETSVLDYIREADNDLAQQIMDNMFTFDDLIERRRQAASRRC